MATIGSFDRAQGAALIELQRRASLVWEDTRADLLAHPEVFVLPTDARIRVAVDDGAIVGFSAMIGPELDGLFVEPDAWKGGIGRALIADVLAWARAEGMRQIEVTANPNALGFYEKVGFRHVGVTETQFGPGYRMTLATTP